jgi:hypothetical protein
MRQYDAIHNLVSFNVARLLLGDDEGENGLESERNYLGDDFVDHIA